MKGWIRPMRGSALPANRSAPARLAHRYVAFAVVVIVLSCALSGGASGVARSAPVQARWVITDLGTLAGRGTSFANGVNNRGQVVGVSSTRDGSSHAFLWQDGKMRDLGTLPGSRTGSRAAAINDRGQIAGTSWGTNRWTTHAVLWENGTVHDLGTLGGKWSYATAINNRGQVVGVSATNDGEWHGFLWQNGRMRDIDDFRPSATNDRGQVVGLGRLPGHSAWRTWRAMLWENGTLRDLGPRGRFGQASGINERGRIVGTVNARDCARLTTWTRPRPSVTISALLRSPCAGGNHDVESQAAINERGQIAATGKGHAYLWENATRLDLGTLPGGDQSIAVAINDGGQIVGASGTLHHWEPDRAVLWTPRRGT